MDTPSFVALLLVCRAEPMDKFTSTDDHRIMHILPYEARLVLLLRRRYTTTVSRTRGFVLTLSHSVEGVKTAGFDVMFCRPSFL